MFRSVYACGNAFRLHLSQFQCEVRMNKSINHAAQQRRAVLKALAAAMGALAASAKLPAQEPTMQQKPSSEKHKLQTSLHYEIEMTATPQRIYSALTDAK